MAAQAVGGSLVVRLLSTSVALANHAGKIIRDIMRKGDLGIVEKGINDLQTEADRSVQRCIVTSLSKQFPKVTIIGEETLEDKDAAKEECLENITDPDILTAKCPDYLLSVKEEDVVIWVDPLDGTAEYTQGLLDHVTVLIGVAVHGKAIGGVIHQPYYNYQQNLEGSHSDLYCTVEQDYTKLGRTMWGIVGLGAYGISHQLPPENKRIIATTRSHSNPTINNAVAAMEPDTVLRVGGAGHKVLLLIEGKAHAYVFASKGCKKWDTCAPEALLHCFGGKLTDIHGEAIKYHKNVELINLGGVLATYSASVHNWYSSRIPDEAKKALPTNG